MSDVQVNPLFIRSSIFHIGVKHDLFVYLFLKGFESRLSVFTFIAMNRLIAIVDLFLCE